MAKRSRLDLLLAERGTFTSRTAAAKAIRAGQVKLGKDGAIALRPSQEVSPDQEIEVLEGQRYVSRGGIKLENGLDALGLDVEGKLCLDVGASTGGFTDCLLQRGAKHVTSLDVAYGQIDYDDEGPPGSHRHRAAERPGPAADRPRLPPRTGGHRCLIHLPDQGASGRGQRDGR